MSRLLDSALGPERRAVCEANDAAMSADNGGKTGHPPGMLQDDSRPLSRWLAGRVDSRMHAREAAQAIEPRPFFRIEDACPADVLTPAQIRELWEV